VAAQKIDPPTLGGLCHIGSLPWWQACHIGTSATVAEETAVLIRLWHSICWALFRPVSWHPPPLAHYLQCMNWHTTCWHTLSHPIRTPFWHIPS